MSSRMAEGEMALPKRVATRLFWITLPALIGLLLICGCQSTTKHTIDIDETHDINGNTLTNCEAEITDHGKYTRIVCKYHDKTVYGMQLSVGYDEWLEAGKPDELVDFTYYYAYTSDGSNHALFYTNADSTKQCWDISLEDKRGNPAGHAFIDTEGYFLKKNPVTGYSNTQERQDRIAANEEYYVNQASHILATLDPNYLVSLGYEDADTSNNPGNNGQRDHSSIPAGAIKWTDASQHVGEIVTVYGPIVNSTVASSSKGRPTYLDMGAAYPASNRVSIVIWGEDAGNFPRSPVSMYEGKTACVTGEVYLYSGACSIKVTSPSQIKTVN